MGRSRRCRWFVMCGKSQKEDGICSGLLLRFRSLIRAYAVVLFLGRREQMTPCPRWGASDRPSALFSAQEEAVLGKVAIRQP